MDAESIESARQEIVAQPLDPNIHYNLAVQLLTSRGRDLYAHLHKPPQPPQNLELLAEAERSCRRALELTPNHGSAHVQLGQIHYFRGDHEIAEKQFKIGLSMPENNSAWRTAAENLGSLYMKQNRLEEAIPVLAWLVGQHPEYGPGRYKLSVCLQSKGLVFTQREEWAAAQAWFKGAINVDPSVVKNLTYLQKAERSIAAAGPNGTAPDVQAILASSVAQLAEACERIADAEIEPKLAEIARKAKEGVRVGRKSSSGAVAIGRDLREETH